MHSFPHEPQFMVSVCRSASHPSLATSSQSVHPLSQITIVHIPCVHAAVAWGSTHTFPHAPQFDVSVSTSTQTPPHRFSPAGHPVPPPAPPMPVLPPAPPPLAVEVEVEVAVAVAVPVAVVVVVAVPVAVVVVVAVP